MPDDSTRTVLVALGAGLGVALAKVGAAVFTGSSAMAAEASHSLADTANDLFLFVAQRRGARTAVIRWGTDGKPTSGPSSPPSACSWPARRSRCAMASPN
jgi:hypothetical protein